MLHNPHYFYSDFYGNSCHLRIMVINNPHNFRIVNFSEPLLKILGYSKEEIFDLPSMRSLYHPDCYEALDQGRMLCLKQGFLDKYELTLKAKNGNKIFVYTDIITTKDRNGNVLYNHCLYRITSDNYDKHNPEIIIAQQHYLETLNKQFIESQDFYKYFYDFYENAPDMFASVTVTGPDYLENVAIATCNNSFAQKLGYSRQELLSMNMDDLYALDNLDEAKKMRAHAIKYGYVENCELKLKKKNGEILHVLLNAIAKVSNERNILSSISLWRDITDLVETRRQLQETNDLLIKQNEEIKTLMHLMSHDIQSPIRAIQNLSQFILEESKDILSPSALYFLHKVQENASKLHYLTHNILTYFLGDSSADLEETDITTVINQVIAYHDIPSTIKINLENDISPFKTKRILLSQIFCNLISNAVKYHPDPENAEIQIKALDAGENWLFIVKDNGPGISPEFHETAFAPLKRLKTEHEVEGSGMGLAIIKKLITQEGGKISLESEEGKGAEFSFTWPKYELRKRSIQQQ